MSSYFLESSFLKVSGLLMLELSFLTSSANQHPFRDHNGENTDRFRVSDGLIFQPKIGRVNRGPFKFTPYSPFLLSDVGSLAFLYFMRRNI